MKFDSIALLDQLIMESLFASLHTGLINEQAVKSGVSIDPGNLNQQERRKNKYPGSIRSFKVKAKSSSEAAIINIIKSSPDFGETSKYANGEYIYMLGAPIRESDIANTKTYLVLIYPKTDDQFSYMPDSAEYIKLADDVEMLYNKLNPYRSIINPPTSPDYIGSSSILTSSYITLRQQAVTDLKADLANLHKQSEVTREQTIKIAKLENDLQTMQDLLSADKTQAVTQGEDDVEHTNTEDTVFVTVPNQSITKQSQLEYLGRTGESAKNLQRAMYTFVMISPDAKPIKDRSEFKNFLAASWNTTQDPNDWDGKIAGKTKAFIELLKGGFDVESDSDLYTQLQQAIGGIFTSLPESKLYKLTEQFNAEKAIEKADKQTNQTNDTRVKTTKPIDKAPPKTTTPAKTPTTTTPKPVTPGFTGATTAGVNTNLITDLNSAAINMQMSLYLSSTHRPKDSDSRHKSGNAVDIAAINGYKYSESDKSTEFKRLGDQLMNYLVKKGYTHNIERGNKKSVLWYMPGAGDANNRHRDHLHVSNMTGATSKTDSAVKYYYTSPTDNNWSSFFTSKVNGTDLTIRPIGDLHNTLASYMSTNNMKKEIDVNTRVWKFSNAMTDIVQKRPAKFFSEYRSWNPFIGGDNEEGASAAFSKMMKSAFSKLGLAGDTLPNYHIASMNMATLYDHVVPHIKSLIENGDQGVVSFPFLFVDTATLKLKKIKQYTITWNYM